MIGLAATAQIAIIPVWFGISFVIGFPVGDTASATQRGVSFLINILTIIVVTIITYTGLGIRGETLRCFDAGA